MSGKILTLRQYTNAAHRRLRADHGLSGRAVRLRFPEEGMQAHWLVHVLDQVEAGVVPSLYVWRLLDRHEKRLIIWSNRVQGDPAYARALLALHEKVTSRA